MDVRYRLEDQAPTLKLDSSAPASPSDVRRGFASPFILEIRNGLCPRFGLCPSLEAKGRTKGAAQNPGGTLTARQSLASHRAAKPERMSQISRSTL